VRTHPPGDGEGRLPARHLRASSGPNRVSLNQNQQQPAQRQAPITTPASSASITYRLERVLDDTAALAHAAAVRAWAADDRAWAAATSHLNVAAHHVWLAAEVLAESAGAA
jgi:hypothetical protein